MKRSIFVCAIALGLSLPALAEEAAPAAHAGHAAMSGMASPSTQAFEAANMKMHEDMAIDYTGDADVDFIKGMIPHHQGAIDMARIVLEHGSDPEVKALAEEIIKAQEGEIAWMQDWLAKHGH